MEKINDFHFNNQTLLDYSLKGWERDNIIDLILSQMLIMQVQNQKLIKIFINNQQSRQSIVASFEKSLWLGTVVQMDW